MHNNKHCASSQIKYFKTYKELGNKCGYRNHRKKVFFFFNCFGTKFQTTFVVCFFFFFFFFFWKKKKKKKKKINNKKYRLERCLYVKLKNWMSKSNSVDPDETVSSGSILFAKAYFIAFRERVKYVNLVL